MSSSDIAVSIQGLSKAYTIAHGALKRPTFRDVVMDRIRRPFHRPQTDTFWALKDISFDVKRGEVLGIIGRNGAGKSTLLKILSRITEPTSGRIELFGRVGSLLEVGTGFHPELTGRENVFLNGAILGMTRAEIRKQFDAIVDFAEVEQFIDTPVKRYSSGMYVRLAFAVAAHLNPEILIVDEVLAVGDAQFQKKCLGKMGEVAKGGRTVLFVSHNMAAIRQLCNTGVVLTRGSVAHIGVADECVNKYNGLDALRRNSILSHGEQQSKAVTIEKILVDGQSGDEITVAGITPSVTIEVHGHIQTPTKVAIEATLCEPSGNVIGIFCPAHFLEHIPTCQLGPITIRAKLRLPCLTAGEYFLNLNLTDPTVAYLWRFPYAVRLTAESVPLRSMRPVIPHNPEFGSVIFEGGIAYETPN